MFEVLKEWWPLGAAIVTAVVGFRSGQERNKWRIEGVERRLDELEQTVKQVRDGRSADAVTLGIIQTTLEQIKGLIGELRTEIKSKADK